MKVKAILVLLAIAVSTAVAQRGGGMGPGPRTQYDASKETKITGTIEEIKTMDTMCAAGTHLVVKTETGNVEVGVGPSQFLQEKKLDLKKGDKVEILGAKTQTRRMGEIFVARQITSGDQTLTLRDEKGIPAWPRGLCRQNKS
jgi:hypothetical protein